jgi:hypothetical protein
MTMALGQGDAMHITQKEIPGFTRSHWMPPSGECLSRIAPAANMASISAEKTHKSHDNCRPQYKTLCVKTTHCSFQREQILSGLTTIFRILPFLVTMGGVC